MITNYTSWLIIMANNIFLAIEDYLADPNDNAAQRIKTLSTLFYYDVVREIKTAYPNKKEIGGDDTMQLILQKLQASAKSAYDNSMSSRFMANNDITDHDREFIFRLTKAQQQSISKIMAELQHENLDYSHGISLAWGYFIERHKSNFNYCDGLEATTRDNNTMLRLQAEELSRRGYHEAARVLWDAHKKINVLCKEYPQPGVSNTHFMAKVAAVLTDAKNAPGIKEQHEIKRFLTNFLYLISVVGLGYLAVTANRRHSFWVPPNKAEAKLGDFAQQVQAQQNEEPDSKHPSFCNKM